MCVKGKSWMFFEGQGVGRVEPDLGILDHAAGMAGPED